MRARRNQPNFLWMLVIVVLIAAVHMAVMGEEL